MNNSQKENCKWPIYIWKRFSLDSNLRNENEHDILLSPVTGDFKWLCNGPFQCRLTTRRGLVVHFAPTPLFKVIASWCILLLGSSLTQIAYIFFQDSLFFFFSPAFSPHLPPINSSIILSSFKVYLWCFGVWASILCINSGLIYKEMGMSNVVFHL